VSKISRREFTKKLGQGVLAVPAAMVVAQLPSHAGDKPMVDPESATAKQLQYKAVTETDAKCSGCLLYTASDDSKGLCSIFPENLVPAEAWCSAYAAKPA
jgi:hypothetical protein